MNSTVKDAYDQLAAWCRQRDYAGWDPFDALNSKTFRATPLSNSRIARLAFTQLIKRSPLNLRVVAGISQEQNSKGIALFALSAMSNYRRVKTETAARDARDLLSRLVELKIERYSGAAWGYNFDWQSRNFFARQGTATIVPTAFAVRALIEGFESFQDDQYLRVARSACDFVLHDLRRTVDNATELCFSYSPEDSTRIFNASLFAAEILASVAAIAGEPDFCDSARRAAQFVVRHQRFDGAWVYGTGAAQSWVDSFHTAYVLHSLTRIMTLCGDPDGSMGAALHRGLTYWRESFFLADGWPKYYDDTLYPADTHAAATAIVTAIELREVDPSLVSLAERVAAWSIDHLRAREGYFYYQKRRGYVIRTPFMRWSQAWMLYALARLLEVSSAP